MPLSEFDTNQLAEHLRDHDEAFEEIFSPRELNNGVDVSSADYKIHEDKVFLHCEEFFLTLADYLEKIDVASGYIGQDVMKYLIRPVYRYQKLMLAERRMAPKDLYPGFKSDLSTDWANSSEDSLSEAASEEVDESRPASQKVEEPSNNDDQHQRPDSLSSEQNAAEIDAILAEVMS